MHVRGEPQQRGFEAGEGSGAQDGLLVRKAGVERLVIEKILRHLGQWNGTPPMAPARSPPNGAEGPWTRAPCEDVDPMPDYENVLTD